MNSEIFIALATCNGGSYLSEQLDSLLAQSETRWKLVIRDDHSVDNTPEIIQEYSQRDERIHCLQDKNGPSGSALGNFSLLLSAAFEAGAGYIFCCDQDDVWDPRKLELMLTRLKELEGGDKAPSLLHHDLAVVSRTLQPVAPSFVQLMQLKPSSQLRPQRLISRNEVTGCAMVCNRSLLEIALPISKEAVMHDWWLALCAGYFGHLGFMPEPLVKYRQHGENTIGAKSFWHGLNPLTNWLAGWRRGDQEFISTVRQAEAFRERMADRLDEESPACQSLDRYCGLLAATRRQRLAALREFDLWRQHWLLNAVLVMRMLLLPRERG